MLYRLCGATKAMNSLKIGSIYQHFKGKHYKILYQAKSSESLEDLVVYEALYDNPSGKIWVRPLSMFLESVEINGATVPRFKFLKD